MTAISGMNSARRSLPSEPGAAPRVSIDPGLLIAAGLFLVVLIVEALFVAITAPTGLDVGVLYVTGT
jgi:hypothetical protein